MNGDGFTDLVVACRDECQNVIYFNDGKGAFLRKQPFGPAKSSTRAIAIADFDGDGRLDIAAFHEGIGLHIYFSDASKGTFGPGLMIAGRERSMGSRPPISIATVTLTSQPHVQTRRAWFSSVDSCEPNDVGPRR